MDVVPVMPGTEDDWEHDAFSGHVDDEFVWGRGTLDMKDQLVCVLESVETLLEKGIAPKRTVYLCFGHNEEVVGSSGGGAQAIAQTLYKRGVRLSAVIDEGGAVVPGSTFGIDGDIAMVGVCEKGYADIKITAKHEGGHASQPPRNNGLVQVCDAVVKLEKNQFKKKLIDPVAMTFTELGKYMKFGMKVVIANLWLTKPLLLHVLSKSKLTNAMIRTTIAPTMAEGSPAGNVLPQTANISVNFRVLQGERIQDVLDHIRKVAKNDNLELEVLRGKEPSAISPMEGREFDLLKSATRKVHGDIPIAPYLMIGGTDSCFFECVSDNIYCISPCRLETDDLARIHGTNERIAKAQLEKGVRFFVEIIMDFCV
jgi:carboxypeptidase PM20D1